MDKRRRDVTEAGRSQLATHTLSCMVQVLKWDTLYAPPTAKLNQGFTTYPLWHTPSRGFLCEGETRICHLLLTVLAA